VPGLLKSCHKALAIIINARALNTRDNIVLFIILGTYKACSKKDQTFAPKTLLLILQHFKHCPLQSIPLSLRYTIPNISSIVGMLPGMHFLWWRAGVLSYFLNLLCGLEMMSFQSGFKFGKLESLLVLSPENRGGRGTMDVWFFAR